MPVQENKVEFGLSNVHIAFIKSQAEGATTYETPEKVPGAVTLTAEPQGDQSSFYADNTTYYVTNSNTGTTGELTMAKLPDKILAKALGWEIDENGALVEVADGIPTAFAILFDVEGDQHKRHCVYYNCTANRPSKENNTKEESVEPTTSTLSYTAIAIEKDGKQIIKAEMELSDTNTEQFNSFFQQVYMPTFGE